MKDCQMHKTETEPCTDLWNVYQHQLEHSFSPDNMHDLLKF